MALLKRVKIWHCDFVIDGVRYRESTGKTDWREAQHRERELLEEAKKGNLAAGAKRKAFARMMFRDATEQWTADRAPGLAPKSVIVEKERARAINRTLGARKVGSITPEDVLTYVRERKSAGISNATVNRELDVIRGVLKKAKRWHVFADEITPLRKTESIGRALLHEEKTRLIKIAAGSACVAVRLFRSNAGPQYDLSRLRIEGHSLARRRSPEAAGHDSEEQDRSWTARHSAQCRRYANCHGDAQKG
jgi:hypothetical protein